MGKEITNRRRRTRRTQTYLRMGRWQYSHGLFVTDAWADKELGSLVWSRLDWLSPNAWGDYGWSLMHMKLLAQHIDGMLVPFTDRI
jgi:hypothetical protein